MELKSSDYRVEISARHVHLSQADFVTLFGADVEMAKVKDLSIIEASFSDIVSKRPPHPDPACIQGAGCSPGR